jgi:hypothetical protein
MALLEVPRDRPAPVRAVHRATRQYFTRKAPRLPIDRLRLRAPDTVTDLTDFAALVPKDHGFAVVSCLRADRTIASSVVNAGVLSHPITEEPVVGFVSVGGARRLEFLRRRPRASVVLRAGGQWAAAEGPTELIGPDDPYPGIDKARLAQLLRDVFRAAGGVHDDWATYDAVMARERRTAVLVSPERVSGNRPQS